MRFHLLWCAFALFVAGCSGGGTKACDPTVDGDRTCAVAEVSYTLQPSSSWQTPAAPLPVGASTTVSFIEIRCVGSSSPYLTVPGQGCSAGYPPAQLVATTLPMPDGTLCPVTFTQTAAGTLRFTRTAPGDPRLRGGPSGVAGYCGVDITDPAHFDPATIVL